MKMKTLEEISHDAFYKMQDYHQLTIDLIEETEYLFNDIYDLEDKAIIQSRLSALSYEIDITIEIFNPIFEIELDDLKCLYILVNEKINELK